MSIHEDSIPLSFTPDGLDESMIDALIGETFTQVSDALIDVPVPTAERPVRRRVTKRTANDRAA